MAAIACSVTLARVRRVLSRVHQVTDCGPDCLCIKFIAALEEEMSKDLLKTPTDYHHTTSTKPSGRCIDNGEPGLPERTHSPNAVDEVTYDRSFGPKGEQK